MKQILRNAQHYAGKSHECVIFDFNSKKIKMTYQAYNASESFNIEIFDGSKWNHFLSMLDIGETPKSSAYILSEEKRQERANKLVTKAEKMSITILK